MANGRQTSGFGQGDLFVSYQGVDRLGITVCQPATVIGGFHCGMYISTSNTRSSVRKSGKLTHLV